jgi:hypothetical protein
MAFLDHLFARFTRYLRLIVLDFLETILTGVLSSDKAGAESPPPNNRLKF